MVLSRRQVFPDCANGGRQVLEVHTELCTVHITSQVGNCNPGPESARARGRKRPTIHCWTRRGGHYTTRNKKTLLRGEDEVIKHNSACLGRKSSSHCRPEPETGKKSFTMHPWDKPSAALVLRPPPHLAHTACFFHMFVFDAILEPNL